MTNTFKHPAIGMLIPMLLLLFSLIQVDSIQAAMSTETQPAHQTDIEYYLKRIEPEKKQNFIKEEARKYRSYPHLDRAYRLQNENRLAEARKEFDAYLTLVPEDLRSRMSYLVLLDKMSLYNQIIIQADFIHNRWPEFIPALFFKGMALQKTGNLDSAFTVFSKIVTTKEIQKRDRVFALSMAVEIALLRQNYEDASRMLQVLIDQEKKHGLYMKAGFIFEKSNNQQGALDAYGSAQKYATSPPEKVAASLALAEIARKMNLTDLAQQAYKTVVSVDSRNQAALRSLAAMAYRDQNYDAAEKWMLRITYSSLKPEDREFLANLYLKRQNYHAAILEFKAIVYQLGKKTPIKTLSAFAQTLESAGRFDESTVVYRLMLANTPENGELYLRYGNLLIRMDKLGEAETFLAKALSLHLTVQQRIITHRNLALVFEKTARHEKAAQEFEKSLLNQQPPGGDLLIRRAQLHSNAGNSEEALRFFDMALMAPNLPDVVRCKLYKEKSVIFEKSDQTSHAILELEKALKSGCLGDAQTSIRLAVLLNKEHRYSEALRYLDQAVVDPLLQDDLKRVAYREKGLLLEKTGHRLEALLEYEKAIAFGDRSPGMYLRVANLYLSGETPEKAIRYFKKAGTHPFATQNEKCSAEEGLGMYSLKEGLIQESINHFSVALRQCGESWQRRYSLGLAKYKAKQWEQALQQFTSAESQGKGPATRLGIALCHKELNRPGAAIHYLLLALQEPENASSEQLKQINDTLGHLYAEEHSYANAADAFTRSLTCSPDQLVVMKLANVLNLADKSVDAFNVLNTVDPNKLKKAELIEYNDLKASLFQKFKRYDEAVALLEKTQKIQETTARSYVLGLLYKERGQLEQAIAHFSAAFEKDPQRNDYALALGYVYVADGRFIDAIRIFELVASRSRESLKIFEELGYLNATIGKNEQAAHWFKKALDSIPVMPQGRSEEATLWKKDAYRIRSEITKLIKGISLALYASYRAGTTSNSLMANGEQISSGLSGQLGLEAAYKPPVIGLYNDRMFEFFGRIFGNLNPDSLTYKGDSTQAGIGLRYKFLQSENLWISAEKLIKVGTYALDDWLLRLLYSRGRGFEPLPMEHNQDYYLVYGEVDGYLRSKTVAMYGEVRKGRSFTLVSDYMIIPHLVIDARWQSPFNSGGSYLEGGAGLSLKHFFNSTFYENYKNVMDFSINYKHGIYFNQGFQNSRGEYDSALFSIGFFF